jgi:TnpA family transposase
MTTLTQLTPAAKRILIAEACGADRDYMTDLNAMHEAEKTLTDAEFSQYAWRVLGDGKIECRAFFGATAAQRADAFLLAKGLAQ